MNLLLLTPQLPYPPHQGTSLRNYHIVRGLAKEGIMLDLLSYDEGDAGGEIPRQLTETCRRIVAVVTPSRTRSERLRQMLVTDLPDMALRLRTRAFESALRDLLKSQDYDVVQIEGIELAWAMEVIRDALPGARIVYDAHNAEALLQRRSGEADRDELRRWPAAFYSWLQSRRLQGYEARVCSEADWITAVSESDRAALIAQDAAAARSISVIANSIDTRQYTGREALEQEAGRAEGYDLVFIGKMDYRPNVDAVLWFARHVWPQILAQVPGASWAVVGQKPHARLSELGRAPGVTVTGWVEDTTPYLLGSRLAIMPFRVGSGTRLKLIEALAAGRPVVSTTVGVEGFAVQDGREVLIRDAAEEFAQGVVSLLSDKSLREELGAAGIGFARRYDWRVVVPAFMSVYERILQTD